MYARHAAHPENLSTDTSSTDNMESLHSALCRIFNKNQILDNRLWREVYSRDASYFNIMPQAVLRPTDVRQVQQLMALCRSRGIGVKNVNDRIKITFGESYGLSIESEPDMGTTVTVRIPRKEVESYEAL